MDSSEAKKRIIKTSKLILGGGISGIFLGLELKNKGINDFIILEREEKPAGLCSSFKLGDSYYDVGAHALHKKAIDSSERLREIIDVNNLFCQKRKAKVFMFNRLIPHPLQLHLYYVPFKIKIKSLFGYLIRKKDIGKNFHDWLLSSFGYNICNFFLFPYNEKIWKTDLNKLSSNWAGRVPSGSWRFIKGLFFSGDKNYSSNEYVCYPTVGGYESLFSKSIDSLKNHLILNTEVIGVDLEKRTVEVKNGTIYHYNELVSTLPIDLFIGHLAHPKNENNIALVKKLEKVSTCLVTFLTDKLNTDLQRIYIPDEKYFAHRVIINSNSSQSLREKGEAVISFEIAFKDRNQLPKEDEILNNCEELIKDLHLLNLDGKIKISKISYLKYMYPTQTLDFKDIILKVQSYIKKYNCYSIGRFGSWSYSNVDGILEEVTDLVNKNF